MELTFGFQLVSERNLSEYNTLARLYRHEKTGAQLLSLENSDENKVFGITFRTPPDDSTGIAHIMEHSVLCGSEKYPLKEPFIELVKGSLNTFLNAFTYPDKTCYPVASQNTQDFYNLMDVYLDAVFHPLISPQTLQQEGWHFELDNPEGPLTYKGVVFNEMKGAYSNPEDILEDNARMSLLPDTPYGVDSGGDPRQIPNLTYAQFKNFHRKYYHPSNARIFFCGNDDPQERLRRMDQALQGFEKQPVTSQIPLQPRFLEPRRAEISFDPGDEEASRKGMLVMNWLLADAQDDQTILGLSILAFILIGTVASPLRKALIDSGYGEDLVGAGLESEIQQIYFSTGLKGVKVDEQGNLLDEKKIEALIQKTLEALVSQRIDPDMISASLNTIEFHLRENNTGSFPQGLLLMLRSLTGWLYDGDPFGPLAFEEPLNQIKNQINAGAPYFENLIRQYLLENKHRTTVLLKPQPGLQQQRDEDEKKQLSQIKSSMQPAAIQDIIRQTEELKALQQRPDPPEIMALLPSLSLDDLDRKNRTIPLEEKNLDGVKVLYHNLFTNGIVYLDLGFDLRSLPEELLPYAPLFGRALLEMGTSREDTVKLSQHIGRSTGGIAPVTLTSTIQGSSRASVNLFLRAKAVPGQVPELLSILEDILFTTRWDNVERFRQIVLEKKAGIEATLAPGGHRFVNLRLRSRYNEADWAAEQLGGISQLFFLRDLIAEIDSDWPSVMGRLEAILDILLNSQSMLFNITLDHTNWASFEPQLFEFAGTIPSYGIADQKWQHGVLGMREGLSIPAQVNFVGTGANLFDFGYQPDGSMDVISNYLRAGWLWDQIRVQGGAYGAFCQFNQRSGVFTFLSYRDPNLLNTLENFKRTAGFLKTLQLDSEELKKSIIGAIGDLDAYQLPDAKGFSSLQRYLAGESDAHRQAWRDQLLETGQADFHTLGDVLEKLNDAGSTVVMGSPEALLKANSERGSFLEITKVL